MSALFNQSEQHAHNSNLLATTGKEAFRHTLERGKASIPQANIKPLTLLHKLEKRANQPLRKQQASAGATRSRQVVTENVSHAQKSSASNQRLKRKKKKLKTSSIGHMDSLHEDPLLRSSTLLSKLKLVKMVNSRPPLTKGKLASTLLLMNEDLVTLTDEDMISEVEQELLLIRPERVHLNSQYEDEDDEDSMDGQDNDVDEFSNHQNISYEDEGDPRVIQEHELASQRSDDTENEDDHIEKLRSRVPAPTAESAMSNRLRVNEHRASIGEETRFTNGRQSAIIPDSPSKKITKEIAPSKILDASSPLRLMKPEILL